MVDKNAEPANQPAQQGRFTCKDMSGELSVWADAKNEAEGRAQFDAYVNAHNLTPKGSVTCSPG